MHVYTVTMSAEVCCKHSQQQKHQAIIQANPTLAPNDLNQHLPLKKRNQN